MMKEQQRIFYQSVFTCWVIFGLCLFGNYWSVSRAWLFEQNMKELVIWTAIGTYLLALFSVVILIFRETKDPVMKIAMNIFMISSLFGFTSYFILKALNIGDAEKPEHLLLLVCCYVFGLGAGIVMRIGLVIWKACQNNRSAAN